MAFLGGFNDQSFIKRNLIAAIIIPVFMVGLLSFFIPATGGGDMEEQMNELTADYYKFTGSNPSAEEVWALSGIYTPYGTDSVGEESTAWGTTPDGWVYGSRIYRYEPSQFPNLAPDGREAYTVSYDEGTGLYYYVEAGADLDVKLSLPATEDTPAQRGTLYTAVSFDPLHQSDVFFTPGDRHTVQEGSYYPFSGWRYVFQPLRDYKASNDLNVERTTTSLSVVWYDYYGDSGLSGQLMLSGSDSGVSYITADEIVAAFNEASYSSKFEMVFNGLDLNVYIKINPYAITFGGYSVEECYKAGFWSIMVTSPSVTTGEGGFVMDAFSPDRIFDIIVKLLTFDVGNYGLSGMAATLCSFVFVVPFYTTLIAIGLNNYPVLILAGLLAAVQGLLSFL